jgi:hypothetical protein
MYLVFSLSNKRLSNANYEQLIQKIANILFGWKASLLSIMGRLILVQTILSDMPIYFMTVFILPKDIIKQIDKIRRDFLWQGNKPTLQTNNFSALTRWQDITTSMDQGGLGVTDLHVMNKALMIKWLGCWAHSSNRWCLQIESQDTKPWELPNAMTF